MSSSGAQGGVLMTHPVLGTRIGLAGDSNVSAVVRAALRDVRQ